MNLPKLVIFDMAGTTVQDNGEVPAAFEAALAEHGVRVTKEQVSGVRGASKRQAILALIPDAVDRVQRAEAAYVSFKQELASRFATQARPIAGAEDTFAWLRERGVKIALNTGFDGEITDLLLASLKWKTGVVDAVVCGDDVREGRPAPELIFCCMKVTNTASADQVCAVGDTVLDLQAGQNAAVRWNIGVLSGAHSREMLRSQPHTRLLASVAELPSLWPDP